MMTYIPLTVSYTWLAESCKLSLLFISMYIKMCGETLDPGKHASLLAMCQLC